MTAARSRRSERNRGHPRATSSSNSRGDGGVGGGNGCGDGVDDGSGGGGGDGGDGGAVPLNLRACMGQSVRVQGAQEGSIDARAMRRASVRDSEIAPLKEV